MEPFNLFKVKGVTKQEYWQCISYIAPTNEKKAWKAKDAIGTYCEVCEIKIPYHSVKNPYGVKRHMEKCHKDLLATHPKNSKKRKGATMDNYFPTAKDKKPNLPQKLIRNILPNSLHDGQLALYDLFRFQKMQSYSLHLILPQELMGS